MADDDGFFAKPEREMDTEETLLASKVYDAIQRFSNYSERSMQSKSFQVGISDLGYCSEYVRRMLDQQEEEPTDVTLAFIGTALGDLIEQACLAVWPTAVAQSEVTLELHGDTGTYRLNGHPDLYIPDEGLLIDFKSVRGYAVVKRTGPKQSQQFQRHCYAKALWEEGAFGDLPLEQVRVANVWIDRSGEERGLHVQMEPYDESVVEQAALWLDDVVYAYMHEEEARKEPPRNVCEQYCGFYSTCRALDTDVEGLITDTEILTAVTLYKEAGQLESVAKKMKNSAKIVLNGVTGSTGEFTVRWVQVAGTSVAYDKQPYQRLDIRKLK